MADTPVVPELKQSDQARFIAEVTAEYYALPVECRWQPIWVIGEEEFRRRWLPDGNSKPSGEVTT